MPVRGVAYSYIESSTLRNFRILPFNPNDCGNAAITDVTLAPRNVSRKVERNATFLLSKPDNMSKARGRCHIRNE